jgi:hypothetical protein
MEGGGEGREVAGDRIALSTLLAFLFGGATTNGFYGYFCWEESQKEETRRRGRYNSFEGVGGARGRGEGRRGAESEG